MESYIDAVKDGLRYAPPGVDVRYLVAYFENQPVGMLSALSANGCSGIYAVATLPEFQRKGVARSLVYRAVEIARMNSSRYLFLQTVAGDEGELAFSRIGFVQGYNRIGYTTREVAESIEHG